LVIEYPSPSLPKDDKVAYYPKLALALLEKPVQQSAKISPTTTTSEDNGDSTAVENVHTVNIPSAETAHARTDNNV